MKKINNQKNIKENTMETMIKINADELLKKYPICKDGVFNNIGSILKNEQLQNKLSPVLGGLFFIGIFLDIHSIAYILKKIICTFDNISEKELLDKYINHEFHFIFNDGILHSKAMEELDEIFYELIKIYDNCPADAFNDLYHLTLHFIFVIIAYKLDTEINQPAN